MCVFFIIFYPCFARVCLFRSSIQQDSTEFRFSYAFHTIITKFVSLQMGIFIFCRHFCYSFLLGILYLVRFCARYLSNIKYSRAFIPKNFCLICFVSHRCIFIHFFVIALLVFLAIGIFFGLLFC